MGKKKQIKTQKYVVKQKDYFFYAKRLDDNGKPEQLRDMASGQVKYMGGKPLYQEELLRFTTEQIIAGASLCSYTVVLDHEDKDQITPLYIRKAIEEQCADRRTGVMTYETYLEEPADSIATEHQRRLLAESKNASLNSENIRLEKEIEELRSLIEKNAKG